jgi:hypothetical protein
MATSAPDRKANTSGSTTVMDNNTRKLEAIKVIIESAKTVITLGTFVAGAIITYAATFNLIKESLFSGC